MITEREDGRERNKKTERETKKDGAAREKESSLRRATGEMAAVVGALEIA